MAKSSFNLERFRTSILTNGLARSNRFEVKIVPPNGMGGARSTFNSSLISLYCEQTSFPGLNIPTSSYKIFGPTYQRPKTIEYGGEGIPLTFHVDPALYIKTFFEDWMHLVVDKTNYTVNYQHVYASTVSIAQLDEQDNITYEIELLEAFPKNINLMELNNSATNQTHRLNVVFGFRYWRRVEQLNPTDVPEQVRYPQVPRRDTRLGERTNSGVSRTGSTNENPTYGTGLVTDN